MVSYEYYENSTLCADGTCCDIIMGVDQPSKNDESITLSPNPASNEILISFDQFAESCTFELTDLNGLVFLRSNVDANRNSISLDGLAKGLNLYCLTSKGKLLKAGKIVQN